MRVMLARPGKGTYTQIRTPRPRETTLARTGGCSEKSEGEERGLAEHLEVAGEDL
jgi:hypothetical protein